MTKRKDPKDLKKRGRKSDYKLEYAQQDYIEGYFEECKEEEKLISLCGLACYIGTTEATLSNWAKEKPEFFRTLGIIRQKSKEMLINKGLWGKYNPTIAKLCLSANHGMREGQDIKHSGEAITIKLPEKMKDM